MAKAIDLKNLDLVSLVRQALEAESFGTVVGLWNTYQQEAGSGDDYIYEDIEEFAELAPAGDPLYVARALFFGDVQNWGDYVYLDAYANLYSAWSVENSPILLDDLAAWLVETGTGLEFHLLYAGHTLAVADSVDELLEDFEEDALEYQRLWRFDHTPTLENCEFYVQLA